jgi:hypothetical protein
MIAENIKNRTLRILKGEDHSSYVLHSKKLFGIITPFLEAVEEQGKRRL